MHGWPQVLADPQLIAADLLVRPGDRIERVPGGANRHGVLVAGAPSPPDVEAVLRRLCDTVRVDVS